MNELIEIGKSDGINQAKMDTLTETRRDHQEMVDSAFSNMAFRYEQHLADVDQVRYACGFVMGYLLAVFGKIGDEF